MPKQKGGKKGAGKGWGNFNGGGPATDGVPKGAKGKSKGKGKTNIGELNMPPYNWVCRPSGDHLLGNCSKAGVMITSKGTIL